MLEKITHTAIAQLIQQQIEKLSERKDEPQTVVDDNNPTAIINDVFSDLEKIKDHIDSCELKAKESLEKAQSAYNKPVGFWHSSTPAIEALQEATQNLGESQVEITETQSLLFRQQKTIANAVSKLFKLSVYNIATTRFAVNEIQLRLSGASKEKISDLAKKELESVLLQLKHQLDLMEQQERLEKKITDCLKRTESLEEKMQTVTVAFDKTCADLQCERENFKQDILHEFEILSQQSKDEISAFQHKSESELRTAVGKSEGKIAEFLRQYKSKLDEFENGQIAGKISFCRKAIFALCFILLLCCSGVAFLSIKIFFTAIP